MKRTISLLSLFLLTVTGFGQVKLGIKAGGSANSAAFYSPNRNSQKEVREGLKAVPGYSLGLAAEYGFTPAMGLQTGLQITQKGYKDVLEFEYGSYFRVTNSWGYLEIPVHFAYKLNNFQIHAGPYAGFGLAGHLVSESYRGGGAAPEKIKRKFIFQDKVSNKEAEELPGTKIFRRRLDLGLNLGAGYRINRVLVTATYAHGFSDHLPDYEDDLHNFNTKTTHKGISLAATWFLWEK